MGVSGEGRRQGVEEGEHRLKLFCGGEGGKEARGEGDEGGRAKERERERGEVEERERGKKMKTLKYLQHNQAFV